MSTNASNVMEQAKALQEEIRTNRRYLHQHAEISLDLPETKAYVKEKLIEMGYEPIDCGKSGVVALAGGKKPGKTFLIRGDMDALPILEEADVDFKCTNGSMHACGHDTHAAMMLGAAKILKQNEDDICGTVKLMFQPGEETFLGAKEMIENGVLQNPDVNAAMMIHIGSAMPMKTGTIMMAGPGVGTAAYDGFKIHIQGKGCHGAMPNMGVDPINVACHIHLALQSINSRELAPDTTAVLTIGIMKSGSAPNILPDKAVMEGTIRTFEEETRVMMKKRMKELVELTAKAHNAEATVEFVNGCPSTVTDKALHDMFKKLGRELMPEGQFIAAEDMPGSGRMAGSEDFGFICEKVPSTVFWLVAGSPAEGYTFPGHHPKAKFDDDVLYYGSALYSFLSMKWLEENK